MIKIKYLRVALITKFDWDGEKRLANIVKYNITFDDLDVLFEDERSISYPSFRHGEERHVLIGLLADSIISVVFVKRGEVIRIISARAARKEEKMLWLKTIPRHS